MDKQTIIFIKVLSAILSVFLLVVSINFIKDIFQGKQAESYPSSVTITANGEAKSIPNIATFQFGVTEKGASVGEAQDKMDTTANKLIDFIKSQGVEEKDIQTTGYNAYPSYDYINGKQTATGYQTSETVSVKIRDTDKAGDVLGGVAQLGATDISGLSFTTEDPDELKKLATEDAVAKAKIKALELSKSVGFRLGKITGFYEENNGGVMPYSVMDSSAMMVKSSNVSVPNIQLGETTITSTVSITYEIK